MEQSRGVSPANREEWKPRIPVRPLVASSGALRQFHLLSPGFHGPGILIARNPIAPGSPSRPPKQHGPRRNWKIQLQACHEYPGNSRIPLARAQKKRLDLSHRTRLSRTKIQPLAYYPNFFVSSRLETRAGHCDAPPGHGPVVQWIEFQIPVLTIGVRISSGSLPLK